MACDYCDAGNEPVEGWHDWGGTPILCDDGYCEVCRGPCQGH